MFQPRYAVIVFLGFLLGCVLCPTELLQLAAEDAGDSGQSVADVAPDTISDPNDPAQDSPAATQAPIMVRLSNPTPRDADCRVTMEIIGREVHFSLRRILAATESLVIGPDRADIVRIDVTFLGEPPITAATQVLCINRDFAPGDTIDFVLTLPVGACCFEGGTCALLTADECAVAGGEYLGDETSCDPNPCPRPILEGACCFDDGTCELLSGDECAEAGGEYQGDDTSCDPNPCPQPEGACCFADGSCQVLTAADCSDAGGEYQGDDTPCDPNPCPQPTGACCFATGMCQVLTEAACSVAGGTYQGDDIACDPSPCPVPLECPADSVFTQNIVDPNEPNAFWTYDASDAGPLGTLRYESLFDAPGEICDIHWWGFMLDEIGEGDFVPCLDPAFEIRFYEDAGEGPDPNAVLCSYVVTATAVPTGRFYDGLELYYFSVDPFDSCCSIADSMAWVSIQGLGDDDCWFYWMSSAFGDGFSVYDVLGDMVWDFVDFSVCLTGTPMPTGACCLGQFCSPDMTEAACIAEEGVYQGDGTTCDPNPCPSPPGNDCSNPIVVQLPGDLPCARADATCARVDEYNGTCLSPYDEGEDYICVLEVTESITVDIVLDPVGTAGTGIALAETCPPSLECLAVSTDDKGMPHGFYGQVLAPGTYYLMVDTAKWAGCAGFGLQID